MQNPSAKKPPQPALQPKQIPTQAGECADIGRSSSTAVGQFSESIKILVGSLHQ
jgi:hypothetical protein